MTEHEEPSSDKINFMEEASRDASRLFMAARGFKEANDPGVRRNYNFSKVSTVKLVDLLMTNLSILEVAREQESLYNIAELEAYLHAIAEEVKRRKQRE